MTERTTADRIHSAAIRFLRAMRRYDDVSGVGAPRLSILSVLYFAGPMSLGTLAVREQVTPATMTRHVQGLEAEGLVARQKTSQDSRIVTVALTAKGRARFEMARRARLGALEGAIGMLDDDAAAALDAAEPVLLALAEMIETGGR